MWPRRFQRVVGLILAVLVFGAAGSDGVRACPHHVGMSHGTVDPAVHAGHAAHDAPPEDSEPCDHDFGICESVHSDPDLLGARTDIETFAQNVSTELALPNGELVPTPDPTFIIPYSTGPPSPSA